MKYRRVVEIKKFFSGDLERLNLSLSDGWVLLEVVHHNPEYSRNPIATKYIVRRVKPL